MSGSGLMPEDRKAWLLAIGQRLKAEYDASAQPVPPRLAALVKKLEAPGVASVPESAPRADRIEEPSGPESGGSTAASPTVAGTFRCGAAAA
jgi:hypothetical protein